MRYLTIVVMLLSLGAWADTSLRPEFAAIAFVVGSCWEGEFEGSGATDRHCFTSVYAGMHIRDVHTVTNGDDIYRGETVYSWDGDAGQVQFYYWNSLGGISTGTVRPEAGRIAFPDEAYTGTDGQQVTVQTYWIPDGPDAYDSLLIETSQSGAVNERRIRYIRVGRAPPE